MLRRISDGEQQSWEAPLERQQKLVNRLALLSPAALLTNTLAELAGTGRARYIDFLRQKGQFEQRYNAYFLPRTLALPQSVFHAADYDLIPTMNYEEEKLNTVLARTLGGLLLLAVYAALCLIVGVVGARHLESRPK